MSFDDDPPAPCGRGGGEPVPGDDAGVPVFECEDCGNVPGLVPPGRAGSDDADAAGEPTSDGTVGADAADGPAFDQEAGSSGSLSTGTVTVANGDLDQLVGLLRSESGPGGTITTDRLLLEVGSVTLEVGSVTLEVTARTGTVEVAEREGG
jgi:hypothetical protein